VSARRVRYARREVLRELSGLGRVRGCGRDAAGHEVVLVRRGDRARWQGVTTCGSVWACPVCSARILAARGEELTQALDAWHEQGGRVVLVTLTMRHGRTDGLAECWDALSDAWAAATGRSSGPRRAMDAAGCAGWARRVEAMWGSRHGWHLHVHALVFVNGITNTGAQALGEAMYGAWEARLQRVGLTPIRDSGGLSVKLLDLDQAREDVAAYVSKGTYTGSERAALELVGTGKLGRNGNVTPWGILDAAAAGDAQAAALWGEWEDASHGRRALTWSRDLRAKLGLGEDLDDDQVAELDDASTEADEPVAVWLGGDWPQLRDVAVDLLEVAEGARPEWAGAAVFAFCVEQGLPLPRPPGELGAGERYPPGPG
jgi:hypothetical protein